MIVKDVNFLPQYLQERNQKAKKNLKIALICIVVIIFISTFFVVPQLIYRYFDAQKDSLDYSLTLLDSVQEKVNILNQINTNSNQKKQILNDLYSKQIVVTEIMNKITNAIPPTVSLKSYSVSGESIVLSFNVDNPMETIDVIRSLENLNMFEEVSVPSVPITDKSDVISFSLKLKHK